MLLHYLVKCTHNIMHVKLRVKRTYKLGITMKNYYDSCNTGLTGTLGKLACKVKRKNYAVMGGHSLTLNRFSVPSHNLSSHIPSPRSKSDSNNLAASIVELSSEESDSSSPRNFPPVCVWCRLRSPVSVGGCSVRTV